MYALYESLVHLVYLAPDSSQFDADIFLVGPVNSKLNWNDNLAAIFEAKLTFNRPSSSVPFYCICRRG